MYFPGIRSFVQGDIPFLDGEVPAANGVVTGRGLAKMYAAMANGGVIDGEVFLSPELTDGLIGKPKAAARPEHAGADAVPPRLPRIANPRFAQGVRSRRSGRHARLGDPSTGSAFAFVHNRLLTAMVFDMGSFAGLARPIRNAITAARKSGAMTVPRYGATFRGSQHTSDAPKRRVAGRR
jgi:hypothetical protein